MVKLYFKKSERPLNIKKWFFLCNLLIIALALAFFNSTIFKIQATQGSSQGNAINNKANHNETLNLDEMWSESFEKQILTHISAINDQGQKKLIPLIDILPNGDIVLITQDKVLHCFSRNGTLNWKRQLSFTMPKTINSIFELFHNIVLNVAQLLFPYYEFQDSESLQNEDVVLHVFQDGNILIGSNNSLLSISCSGSFKWKKRETGLIYSPNYNLALLLRKMDQHFFLKAIDSKGKVIWSISQEGDLKRIWKENNSLYVYFKHEATGSLYCINRDYKINKINSGIALQRTSNYRTNLTEKGIIAYPNHSHYKNLLKKSQRFIINFITHDPNYRHDKDKNIIMFSDLNNNPIWSYAVFLVDEFIEDIRWMQKNEQLTVLTQFFDQDALIKTRIFALDLKGKLLWEEIFLNKGLTNFKINSFQGLFINSFDKNENLYFILQTKNDDLIVHELIGLTPDGDLFLSKTLDDNVINKNKLGTSAYIIPSKQQGYVLITSTDNEEIFFNKIAVLYDK